LTTQKPLQPRILVNISLFAVLTLVTVIIAAIYISSEKYFYYWDLSNYSNQTSELISAFHVSILQGLRVFKASLITEYNKLPCLPLVPFTLIFGDSRLAYIVSNTLVYILPFSLLMGAIATKVIPMHPRLVFWSTAFLTILIPTLSGAENS
jgi:hypothetical protein